MDLRATSLRFESVGLRAAFVAFVAFAFGFPLSPSTTRAQVGEWTTKASSPTKRRAPAVAALNGLVYAAGGGAEGSTSSITTVEAYDPATDTWTGKPSLPIATQQAAGATLNGILYVAAGGTCCGPLGTLQAYDPATNIWTVKQGMPTPRYKPAAGAVNSKLYVAGGGSGTGVLFNSFEEYDPTTDFWAVKSPIPTPRSGLGIGVVSGIIYAVGGADLNSVLGTVEAYDPATDLWTPRSPMPTPRANIAVSVIDGILYAAGGFGTTGNVSTVEAYNPATDSWSTVASMPAPRTADSDVINGVMYAVGSECCAHPLTVDAFTPVLTVAIDIKPGSDPNSINLGSSGVVPVAILGSATFDATRVDPESVTLAGASVRMIGRGSKFACAQGDPNGDGFVDLVCHVETAQFMIETGSSSAVLTAKTFGGQSIRGEDSIHIVP